MCKVKLIFTTRLLLRLDFFGGISKIDEFQCGLTSIKVNCAAFWQNTLVFRQISKVFAVIYLNFSFDAAGIVHIVGFKVGQNANLITR